jgi:hypothetical protein
LTRQVLDVIGFGRLVDKLELNHIQGRENFFHYVFKDIISEDQAMQMYTKLDELPDYILENLIDELLINKDYEENK